MAILVTSDKRKKCGAQFKTTPAKPFYSPANYFSFTEKQCHLDFHCGTFWTFFKTCKEGCKKNIRFLADIPCWPKVSTLSFKHSFSVKKSEGLDGKHVRGRQPPKASYSRGVDKKVRLVESLVFLPQLHNFLISS